METAFGVFNEDNKQFKAETEKRDLKIEYAQYIGYSVTSPTDKFIEVIKENGLSAEINHCRTMGNSAVVPPVCGDDNGIFGGDIEKKKTNTRKYVCQHCGISVRATKLVFSVDDNVNPMDTSAAGDIYELDLGTKQLSHMIHLYHAANPICSYGDQVALDDNYDPIPNSPKNPAPYPVYLYKKGDKCIYRLSPDKADFSPPSQNERFIAWQSSYVYDLKTGTYYTVPGRFSYIVGDYLTWADRQNGILYWAQLPN